MSMSSSLYCGLEELLKGDRVCFSKRDIMVVLDVGGEDTMQMRSIALRVFETIVGSDGRRTNSICLLFRK